MDHFDNQIKKEVNEFLQKNIRFTQEEGESIRRKIQNKKSRSLKFDPVYWTVLVAAASIFIFFSASFIGDLRQNTTTGNYEIPGFVDEERQNESLYQGEDLSIGVLGNRPEINEEQINFRVISFKEFTIEEIRSFDAIFIMKENLSTAAEKQYTNIFTDSNIPFFFINSNKGAYPFIDENLEYNEAREIPYHDYFATGYLFTPEGAEMTWTYESTIENNKDAFSKIFKTIERASPHTFNAGS